MEELCYKIFNKILQVKIDNFLIFVKFLSNRKKGDLSKIALFRKPNEILFTVFRIRNHKYRGV
jgi:hypothetical protein